MLNGVTELHMMKADVLDDFDEIKVCTHYRLPNGDLTDVLPFDIANQHLEPVYEKFEGWRYDLSTVPLYKELPEYFHIYLRYLEWNLRLPISIVSVGPNRNHTLLKEDLSVSK